MYGYILAHSSRTAHHCGEVMAAGIEGGAQQGFEKEMETGIVQMRSFGGMRRGTDQEKQEVLA